MNTSEQINEIAKAFAAAQAEMQNPGFDKKNPHFKSSYASLASVRKSVLPVMTKHGISVVQNIGSTDHGVTCSNLLMHSSGQWIKTDAIEVPADKHNAHGYGSACTYARRFSLMALACVVGDEDDDGNEAAANPPVKLTQSSKSVPRACWDELDAEEQAFLLGLHKEVVAAFSESPDNGFAKYMEIKKTLDNDEVIAWWYLFDSKQRTYLDKKEEQFLKDQKKAA